MFSSTYKPNEVRLDSSQVQELILLIARSAYFDKRTKGWRASTKEVDQSTMRCFKLLCENYSIPFDGRTYETTGYSNQYGGEYQLTQTGFDFTDSLEILLDKFSQAIPSLREQLNKLKPSQDKAVLELANKVADISRITDAKIIQKLRSQPYKVTLSDVNSTALNKLTSLFRLHRVSCTISTSSSNYDDPWGSIR